MNMNEIVKYPSIPRIGKISLSENIDYSKIYVLEKLDGAHASIQIEVQNDELVVYPFSRNKLLTSSEGLRGFYEYVNDTLISELTLIMNYYDLDGCILHGEWLVPHTVAYAENYYHKFYLYDIYNSKENKWLDFPSVCMFAASLNSVYQTPLLGVIEYNSPDCLTQIKNDLVGRSSLTKEHKDNGNYRGGEGVVLRFEVDNSTRIKIVSEGFSENFGTKSKETKLIDPSVLLMNQFLTDMRIDKKIYSLYDQNELPQISFQNFGDIAKPVIEEVYKDVITEEITPIPEWFDEKAARKSVSKKVPLRLRPFIESFS